MATWRVWVSGKARGQVDRDAVIRALIMWCQLRAGERGVDDLPGADREIGLPDHLFDGTSGLGE